MPCACYKRESVLYKQSVLKLQSFHTVTDEDSNLEPSPLPDMDTDSFLEGPMDEEEKWLDALEKGELDDNGELKKEIDESLLTARQVLCWTVAFFLSLVIPAY